MVRRLNGNRRTITVTQLRRNFNTVVRRLRQRHEHAVILSKGTSVAVLLSPAEYQRLVGRRRAQAAFNAFSRSFGREVERRGLTEEQLLEDLEKTKHEVFEERYGRIK